MSRLQACGREQVSQLAPDGDNLRALLRTMSSRPPAPPRSVSLSALRAPLGVSTGRCVGAVESGWTPAGLVPAQTHDQIRERAGSTTGSAPAWCVWVSTWQLGPRRQRRGTAMESPEVGLHAGVLICILIMHCWCAAAETLRQLTDVPAGEGAFAGGGVAEDGRRSCLHAL